MAGSAAWDWMVSLEMLLRDLVTVTDSLSGEVSMRKMNWIAAGLLVATVGANVEAQAVRTNVGFTSNVFAGNDDGSIGPLGFGFAINFFGNIHSSGFLNNNGNMTFGGGDGTYTPSGITAGSRERLAPFFADVDTRASAPVTYGTSTVNSHLAWAANWINVGFYAGRNNPTNSFQMVLIDRSDVAAGDFDFEFNFDRVLWETGQASGGSSSGLGGSSAHMGWTNGAGTYYENACSGVNGACLDGAGSGLIHHSINSSVDGRYNFIVRSGHVDSGVAPEPGTIVLTASGLVGLVGFVRRRRTV